MHPLLAIFPLAALILLMTLPLRRLRLPLRAEHALPLAAALALAAHLLDRAIAPPPPSAPPPLLIPLLARIIEGLLASLTPLAIVFGAILLFATLQASGAMAALTNWLRRLSPDPLMQVVLIGWAFSYLVEGLSGFGTPAALAAPILVGLGFPAVRVAAATLVMNTVPVVFGAVGTPIWFGLGQLALSDAELRRIAIDAATVQLAAGPVIALLALRLLFPWRDIRRRLAPVLLVVAATVGASFLVARVSVEFPSIVGGLCGMAAAIFAARTIAGRAEGSDSSAHDPAATPPSGPSVLRSAIPLLATVLILAVTRLEPLGLRALLTAESPAATARLGVVGDFSVSPALVVQLQNILGTDIDWSMPLLYVPFILPFVVVALLSAPLLRLSPSGVARVWSQTLHRLLRPAIALAGALVLVKLMMHGGTDAPVMVIGHTMARAVSAVHRDLWLAAAPLLGALGSFFSGSATVSNLTFAPVQDAIAAQLALDRTTVLAMQTTGGAMGNMVCIHNIVAVAAVLGLTRPPRRRQAPAEAARDPVVAILRLTIGPLAVYAAIAAAAAWLL